MATEQTLAIGSDQLPSPFLCGGGVALRESPLEHPRDSSDPGARQPELRELAAPLEEAADPVANQLEHQVSARGVDQLGELAQRFQVSLFIRLAIPHDPQELARLRQLLVGPALDGEADGAREQQLQHIQALRGQDRIRSAIDHQQVFEDIETRFLDRDHTGATAGTDLDQALMLQLLQRLANRSAVRLHPCGQIPFRGQALSGPVVLTEDLVAELLGDLLGDGGGVGHRGAL